VSVVKVDRRIDAGSYFVYSINTKSYRKPDAIARVERYCP
jgi:hypothetical protein